MIIVKPVFNFILSIMLPKKDAEERMSNSCYLGVATMYKYLDLFAGAGGLSEGFSEAGFEAVAHIEMNEAACFTLKTRNAYRWLLKNGKQDVYSQYLSQKISRDDFYSAVPSSQIGNVLNYEISMSNLQEIFGKIDAFLNSEKLDLIIGGPPCQAYSLAGRARDKNKMVGDKRNYLYLLYAEFLKKYLPTMFIFENVLGLLSARDKKNRLYFKKMRRLFKKIGYSTEYKVLNAKDYGVLQNRRRVILVGKLNGKKNIFPAIEKDTSNYSVREIFADLPKIQAGKGTPLPVKTLNYSGQYLYSSGIKKNNFDSVTLHWSRPNTKNDLRIYRLAVRMWDKKKARISYCDLPSKLQTQKNTKSFLDRFKVVAADLPFSQTVVAHISKDGHYFIHPDLAQNRSLTPREVARLQTFPDDFYFESKSGKPSRTEAFKQIGNAVPVLLAKKIALGIMGELNHGNYKQR
jgi:DNA (cytosine-5)-methyltransferase 1